MILKKKTVNSKILRYFWCHIRGFGELGKEGKKKSLNVRFVYDKSENLSFGSILQRLLHIQHAPRTFKLRAVNRLFAPACVQGLRAWGYQLPSTVGLIKAFVALDQSKQPSGRFCRRLDVKEGQRMWSYGK